MVGTVESIVVFAKAQDVSTSKSRVQTQRPAARTKSNPISNM